MRPFRPFICLNGACRIGAFERIAVAGEQKSMVDRVHNSLRTAIIGSLSVDAMDSAQPESAINCFIRTHKNLVDSDIRMFVNNDWMNNIVGPPNI
jgi:hypothetical protein